MGKKVEAGKLGEKVWSLVLEAVSSNVLPLTSRCNLRCLFCSHYQNPPGVQAYSIPPLSPSLLEEIIPYLKPEQKIIIGESTTRLCEGEPLTHPHFLEVMKTLRRYFPRTPLQVTTNGALLDKETAAGLKALTGEGGLELVISLNSSSAEGRKKIMGDGSFNSVAEGLLLCSKLGLPFHGSVVALPHILGWDDLAETLWFLEKTGALTTRVFLPGYTRLAPPHLRFESSLWQEICFFLDELREQLEHPLVPEPSPKRDFCARVEGVIRHTPAWKAGLQKGDLLLSVNGEDVLSAVEAFYQMKKSASPVLLVKRTEGSSGLKKTGQVLNLTLEKARDEPPGTVFFHDLDGASVQKIRKEVEICGEDRPVLLLTSTAAQPLLQAALDQGLLSPGLQVFPLENRFFGGSICSAGLLVLSDIEEGLERFLFEQERPAKIIIPSAPFDRAGYDLVGRHYSELDADYPLLSFSFL